MKAGVFEGIGKIVPREVPDLRLKDGSIIVKVKVCSICGTDLRVFRYGHARVTPPQIIGHEVTGVIVAVANNVPGYKTGDRVAITPRVSCGECFYCCKGMPIYCLNSCTFGFQLPGGFAESMLVPPRAIAFGVLNKIADGISFEEASLAEPLACCIRAQKAADVGTGDTMVVIGGGSMGIMHCRLGKAYGASQVILIERNSHRLGVVDLAAVDEVIISTKQDPEKRIALLTGDSGADVVIVACSSTEAQEQALSLAGRGGRVNFFGGLPQGQSEISIDSNLIHYKEISIQGTHSCLPDDNREALEMISAGRLKIADLITHTFPLDSIAEAFEFAGSNKGMHVAIYP